MGDRFWLWLGEMKAMWFTHSSKEEIARTAFIAGMNESTKILAERKGKEPSTEEIENELNSCIYDIECEIIKLKNFYKGVNNDNT